jgi:hypothetical protein
MWRRTLVTTLLGLFAVSGLQGVTSAQVPTVMIPNVTTRHAVARAIDGAMRRLEGAQCQSLLDEFSDASGAPLRTVLSQANVTPVEFLSRLRFAEGNATRQCQRTDGLVAFTMPGNRVIFICSSMFDLTFRDQMRAAQMIIIHEMLHAVGLGENPPTSGEITARVTKRCGA